MKRMSISKLISFLICIITWKICLTNGTCPSPFIVQPCRCLDLNETRVIKCVHIELSALRNVFHKMSVQLDDDSKTFDAFYLGKSDMRMIPENIFQDISFKHIYFERCKNLQYLHPNAFSRMAAPIEFFNAWQTQLASYRIPNDFDALSKLVHLKFLDIHQESKCPPPEVIDPCYCKVNPDAMGSNLIATRDSISIHCDDGEKYFLRSIFQRITNHAQLQNSSVHFDEFHLDDTAFTNYTYFPEDSFAEVTFSKLFLQNCKTCNKFKLHINRRAFGKTAPYVQLVNISTNFKSNSLELEETFVAISSLPNLRQLHINAGFNSIPSHLFRTIGIRAQKLLSQLKITGNIKRLSSYGFYVIPRPQLIDISYNQITKIEKHAFAFRDKMPTPLTINLSGNNLTINSFEKGALVRSHRPVHLILAQNSKDCNVHLRFLDQRIFEPFLKGHPSNQLTIGPCQMFCDCNLKWLYDAPEAIKERIRGGVNLISGYMPCINGKSLFGHSPEHFSHCDQLAKWIRN